MDVANDTVFVDGTPVGDDAAVREGSLVRTDENGRGTVEFDDDPGNCAILQSTEVEVTSLAAALDSGKLDCGGRGGKGVRIRVGDKTVTVVNGQVEVKVVGGTPTVRVTEGSATVRKGAGPPLKLLPTREDVEL